MQVFLVDGITLQECRTVRQMNSCVLWYQGFQKVILATGCDNESMLMIAASTFGLGTTLANIVIIII